MERFADAAWVCYKETQFAAWVAMLACVVGTTYLACVCAFSGFSLLFLIVSTCSAIASLCDIQVKTGRHVLSRIPAVVCTATSSSITVSRYKILS